MTLGRTSDNKIKIKTDKEGGGLRAVECACCGGECESDMQIQSLTASLPHYGFAPFSCDGGENSSSTRYLSVTYSGLATSGCGQEKKHGPAFRTYTIDPFTGYQCISGDSQPQFWCASTGNPDCTPTTKKWDCGTISTQQVQLNCNASQDQQGNTLRRTLTESLSQPYTLNEVESNVDALLAQNPITDTSMPPGAAGTVVVGTGHSIITWQGGTATSSYFYKGNGHVVKTKLRLKFPTARTYKLTTKDQDGNVLLEEERQATEGQIVDVPPPSLPGSISVQPYCGFHTLGTALECNVSGSHITRRLVCRNEENEEIPCPPCPIFIGPDCQDYNTITHERTASRSFSSIDTVSGELYYASSDVASGNVSNSYIERACPYRTECVELSGSATRTVIFQEGDPETCDLQISSCDSGPDCISGIGCNAKYEYQYTGPSEGDCSGDFFSQSFGNPLEWLGNHASCSKITSFNSSETLDLPEGFDPECRDQINETYSVDEAGTQNVTISGNTITSSFSFNKTTQFDGTYTDDNPEVFCVSPGTVSNTTTDQRSYNYTSTYSNTDGNENGWESLTLPWCSGGQAEGCMAFSGCVENYKAAAFSTQSSATVSCTAKFTAPQATEPQNFNTWFHYYTTEDSGPSGVETNLGAVGCRIRTVVVHNSQTGSTSSGGQVSLIAPVISLTTSEGKTKCLSGPIAYTYELPAE